MEFAIFENTTPVAGPDPPFDKKSGPFTTKITEICKTRESEKERAKALEREMGS